MSDAPHVRRAAADPSVRAKVLSELADLIRDDADWLADRLSLLAALEQRRAAEQPTLPIVCGERHGGSGLQCLRPCGHGGSHQHSGLSWAVVAR